MDQQEVIKNILSDIKVELLDLFDQNFEKKSFFNKSWKKRQFEDRGSLMNTTGALRNSLKGTTSNNSVTFSSNVPYAGIHNEGGKIKVTAQMKSFFWAKYYENNGKIKTKKNGTRSNSKRNVDLTAKAQFWQSMALKKIGSEIKIPQRQFLGNSPEVEKAVESIIIDNLNDYFKEMADNINTKIKKQ